MNKKPVILITNDDGITAPGIRALVEVASEFGEIYVVAPDSPQSGQGHAITIESPLKLKEVNPFDGIPAWECSGTPVDCVKLAKHVILKGRKIDLCLSGINHGSNAAVNIIYSGTMSAAMEASLDDIQSIGLSHLAYAYNIDFEPCKPFIKKLIEYSLSNEEKKWKLLNVNFPDLPLDQIKGMKICRQANARWVEEFQEAEDPRGRKYYWLAGSFVNNDKGEDSDVTALENGYISVVPSAHDLTDYPAIPTLKDLENNA